MTGDRLDESSAEGPFPAEGDFVRIIGATPVAPGPEPPAETAEIEVIDAFAGSAELRSTTSAAGADEPGDSGDDSSGGPRRTVIVIDADNPVDRTAPSSSAAAGAVAVDPRIRARRRGVRQAAGRRRLRWLIAGVTVALVVVGAVAAFTSPLLSVRHVRVTGQVYSSPDALQQVVDDLQGKPMARVDLGRARSLLSIQPWIRRVSVRRVWPTTIEIDIAERVPVAVYGAQDENWHVYDVDGRVLATLLNQPVDPVLVKGDPNPVPDGELVSKPMIDAGRLAQALPKRLREPLESINVGGDGRMELQMKNSTTIYFGTIDSMREKLVGVLTVIDRCNGAPFKKLNVDAPRDIVIEPSTACGGKTLTSQSP